VASEDDEDLKAEELETASRTFPKRVPYAQMGPAELRAE
jgi:hypothetical protein